MNATQSMKMPLLRTMVEGLERALGDRLVSLVLYGSAARDDYQEGASDFNLVVVTADLEPPTLEALAAPLAAWVRKGQPPPRMLTKALLTDSLDVFPIELLDIRSHHVVLRGEDCFAGLRVRTDMLRLQCERELREKLMRLREGYVEAHGSQAALQRLLAASFTTFTALVRGCRQLVRVAPPKHSAEVAAAFCTLAGLDVAPFDAIEQLRHGGRQPLAELRNRFSRYYEQLQRAAGAIDAFKPDDGEETR